MSLLLPFWRFRLLMNDVPRLPFPLSPAAYIPTVRTAFERAEEGLGESRLVCWSGPWRALLGRISWHWQQPVRIQPTLLLLSQAAAAGLVRTEGTYHHS